MKTKQQIKTNKSSDEIREGFVNVEGGKIWYKIAGFNKANTPLLAIHGGPGVPHDYLEPLQALADERPVIFYDQLGCGQSDNPADPALWNIRRYVDELRKLRMALGLDRVHLLGQSWGSALAVDYLLTHQANGVASLVLSGPLISTSTWIDDQKTYIAMLPADVKEVILKNEASGDYGSQHYQDAMMYYYSLHVCRLQEWPDCLNRSFEKLNFQLYNHMWGPSEFTVTGALKDYEREHRLREIKVPTLFTCGRYDEAKPDTVARFRDKLPGSTMHIFEEASHEHHLEKTDEFIKLLRDFLRSAD